MDTLRRVTLSGVAVLLVLVAGCTAGRSDTDSSADAARFPDPVASLLPATQASALQSVLDNIVDFDKRFSSDQGAPGVTAAVLSDRGAWQGAAGHDGNGVALTPDAMMGIADITKTFLAAEVMHLAAAGRVDLNAPLSKYIDHPLALTGATVRQALGMRSGLAEFGDAYDRAVRAGPGRHWTPTEALSYQPGPAFPPGVRSVYSKANYLLLGLLVEAVSRRSLAQALRADLIAPSNLNRVAVQAAERPTPPLGAPTSSTPWDHPMAICRAAP
jgi:D-alanyl-D-alanine carboxypeptidase